MSEREPDHSEDPRQRDTGDQMPEDAPDGHTEGKAGGDQPHDRGPDPDAPDTTGGREGNAGGGAGEGSQSTGNPNAAG